MIYHIYFSAVTDNEQVVTTFNKHHYPNKEIGEPTGVETVGSKLAKFIHSSQDDSFLFILVDQRYNHLATFDKWIEKYGLKDLIVKRTGLITNPIHQEYGPNLQLVVMQSKEHFQRKESGNEVQAWS